MSYSVIDNSSGLVGLSMLTPKDFNALNYLINLERDGYPEMLITLSQCYEPVEVRDSDESRSSKQCPTRHMVIRLMRRLQRQERRFAGHYCNTYNSHEAAQAGRVIIRASERMGRQNLQNGRITYSIFSLYFSTI